MKIEVDLSSFEAGMGALMAGFQARVEKGVSDAALQVERAAKENLKEDARGKHLLSSIHTQVASEGARVTAKVGVGGATDIEGARVTAKVGVGGATDIEYIEYDAAMNFGIYVHEGTGIYSRSGMGRKKVPWFYVDLKGEGHTTSGMQPNPFLENAYNSEGGRVAQIVTDAIMGG